METTDAMARAGTPVRLIAIMHDRIARTQWLGADKYVGDPKNSYVIVRLARSRISALSFPPVAAIFLTEERCLDGVGRLSEDPKGVL